VRKELVLSEVEGACPELVEALPAFRSFSEGGSKALPEHSRRIEGVAKGSNGLLFVDLLFASSSRHG